MSDPSGGRQRPDPDGQPGRGSLLYRLLRAWVRLCARLLHHDRRTGWMREWDGELWYGVEARPPGQRLRMTPGTALGILSDAWHVRRRTVGGRLARGGDGALDRAVRDVRVGLRGLRKSPGFTAVVVATLAIGIGGTVGLFSVVQALLMTPLPYPEADRLVHLWQGRRGAGIDRDWLSPALYGDIRDQTDAFEALAFTYRSSSTLSGQGRAREVGWVQAQSSYLDLIGARIALGRGLSAADDQAGAVEVVVLTDALWEAAFGRDPDVVGRSVILDGVSYPIVGVLGTALIDDDVLPSYETTGSVDLVRSFPMTPEFAAIRDWESYNVLGRLRAGVSLAHAQSQLDDLARTVQALHEADPNSGFFIEALPILDQVVRRVRPSLLLLLGAAAAVLLVACLNVANLLTGRHLGRRSELSVRAALGADRSTIVRQLFTESALLALLGGALGISLACVLVPVLRTQSFVRLPRVAEIGIDGGVLAFTLVVTGLTCILFGMAPAFRAARADLACGLRSAGRVAGDSRGRRGLSGALVVVQVGVSLMLLVGGALLGRSFRALHLVDPGFEVEHRLTFRVSPVGPAYATREARVAFHRELARRLRTLPGVESAGAVSRLPFSGVLSFAPIDLVGYEPPQGASHEIVAAYRVVTPDYFETMEIPLVRGRAFDGRDDASGAPVAIIDEQFAEKYFPGLDPIGYRVSGWLDGEDAATIVGVAATVKHDALDASSRITAYYPHRQVGSRAMHFVVATEGSPEALVEPVRRLIEDLDPDVAMVDTRALEGRVRSSLAARQLAMVLVQGLGAIALALAALGLYGVVSFRVRRSTAEIGIRLALGASDGSILRTILGRGMTLGAAGVALGLVFSLAAAGILRSVLFGIEPLDTLSFFAVAATTMGSTFLACWVPARRATRLDPLTSLKG